MKFVLLFLVTLLAQESTTDTTSLDDTSTTIVDYSTTDTMDTTSTPTTMSTTSTATTSTTSSSTTTTSSSKTTTSSSTTKTTTSSSTSTLTSTTTTRSFTTTTGTTTSTTITPTSTTLTSTSTTVTPTTTYTSTSTTKTSSTSTSSSTTKSTTSKTSLTSNTSTPTTTSTLSSVLKSSTLQNTNSPTYQVSSPLIVNGNITLQVGQASTTILNSVDVASTQIDTESDLATADLTTSLAALAQLTSISSQSIQVVFTQQTIDLVLSAYSQVEHLSLLLSSTSKDQDGPATITSTSALTGLITTFAAIGGGLIIVAGSIFAYCCCFRSKRKAARQAPLQVNNNTSMSPTQMEAGNQSTSGVPITTDTVNSTQMASNSVFRTAVNEQQEMSLPGYLLMYNNNDYKIEGKPMGEGGFSMVYQGKILSPEALKRCNNEVRCAIKVIKETPNATKQLLEEDEQAFKQEVSLLNYFAGNKLFTQMVGFSVNPNTIIMKFYPYGNVEDILGGTSKHAQWSLDLMLLLLQDTVDALAIMHHEGFCHADVKPANIMINRESDQERFHAVLSDFGITQIVSKKALLVKSFEVSRLQGASVTYAAPELLKRFVDPASPIERQPSKKLKQDVYAVSILGFEMITRSAAWNGRPDEQVIQVAINGGRPNWPNQFVTMRRQDIRITRACKAMELGWSMNPDDRPEMHQMLLILRGR